MCNELCDECRIHFPEEYTATCFRCRKTLCPICDEDGHACAQTEAEADQLPLAA